MYTLYGFECQIIGLPKTLIKSTLARLENKYSRSMFDAMSTGRGMTIHLSFDKKTGKYKIRVDIEYTTILPRLNVKRIKLEK